MKVLIISDTHGKSSCIEQIYDIVGDVDMLIHLGDVEGDEELIQDLFNCEIHMVRGNCDYNAELPIYDEFNIGDKRAFITHGHRYGVNSGTAYLEELIDTEGYDFVMYGHTHRRDLTTYKNSYIVNPGSLALPRDNRVGTYMLLDFDQHGTPFFAENELPNIDTPEEKKRKKFLRICGDRAEVGLGGRRIKSLCLLETNEYEMAGK